MRNKIFGGIGAVWGALILLRWFTAPAAPNGAYDSGTNVAAILGMLMLVIGVYTFVKKPKSKIEKRGNSE